MTTPVHSTSETGAMGEDMAKVIFQKIRWAPPEKLRQDIGTDLITFARDTAAPDAKAATYDRGAPVFMQVKGSEKEYLKPKHKHDGQPGWWFAESTTYHFDHWLSFGLPYLLVLVDVTNQVAYWAEVTGKAIRSTGKGRKIFVPAARKVDADSLDALNKIATSRRSYDLEGTAWTGKLNDLGPADRLRYALILPRLVAPHPNSEPDHVTFEEAAAMVLRNRGNELAHLAGIGHCPLPQDWATHKEWGWRFAYVLHELLTTGSSSRFPALASSARHRFERDACLVIDACIAYVGDGATRAAGLLKPSSATKPADRGWLKAHLAVLLFELDKPKEAAKAAKEALFAMKSLDGDVTVSAIRGGAAAVLYSTAGLAAGNVSETISAQDNAASWWRAQDVSWALEKDLKLRFERWAENNTMHIVTSTARSELTSATWNAAFSAAWGSWRHLARLNSQLVFTTTADPLQMASALSMLVYVGEKKAAKEAAQKLWMDGPVVPLKAAVTLLATRTWTKRDEGATLAVLGVAGDLLDAKAADATVARILDVLKTGGAVRTHGGAWSFRWAEADKALHRLLLAGSIKSHRACADVVAEQFAGADTGVADALVRVAHALATAELGIQRLRTLTKVATARTDHYGTDLLEILGTDSPTALPELRVRAKAGDRRAVRALLTNGSEERDDYIEFGRAAAATVKEMVVDAGGVEGVIKVTGYEHDQLHELTLAALNTDDTKLWKAVTDALEANVIEQTQLDTSRRVRRLVFMSHPASGRARL